MPLRGENHCLVITQLLITPVLPVPPLSSTQASLTRLGWCDLCAAGFGWDNPRAEVKTRGHPITFYVELVAAVSEFGSCEEKCVSCGSSAER